MNAPVRYGCSALIAIAALAAGPTFRGPSPVQQCMTEQDAGNPHPDLTGSCQVGAVRNP